MGFLDDMNRLGEQQHRRKERKHMKATQQQGTAVVDVQSAILAELRRLNEQVAWQNQAMRLIHKPQEWHFRASVCRLS
jgi:hypothetical protein